MRRTARRLPGRAWNPVIVFRARRNHPPSAWQKRFNRLVAKQRWIIEQGFGTLKGLFHGGLPATSRGRKSRRS
ncbi:MAG: transposase [Hyphomonadaceae bacterium]|nr:transposase [Hyphomonadaceae bacterium]MBC6412682.1 transposase [Hyphomonadaceae bacterium]